MHTYVMFSYRGASVSTSQDAVTSTTVCGLTVVINLLRSLLKMFYSNLLYCCQLRVVIILIGNICWRSFTSPCGP